MSTRCSEAAQTEFLGHISTNCASLKGSRSLQQHRHFFWHLQVSKENLTMSAVPTPALEKLVNIPFVPLQQGGASLINILFRNK